METEKQINGDAEATNGGAKRKEREKRGKGEGKGRGKGEGKGEGKKKGKGGENRDNNVGYAPVIKGLLESILVIQNPAGP